MARYNSMTGILYDAVNNCLVRQTPQGPVAIGGPKGDKGDTGPTGPKGDKGDEGNTGNSGASGNNRSTLGNTIVNHAFNGDVHQAPVDGFVVIGATSATSNYPQLFVMDASGYGLFDMVQSTYSSGITPIAAGQKYSLTNSNHARIYRFIPAAIA